MHEEKELRRIASKIQEFGWQVISVPESGQYPSFAYSIGLTKTFQHPEILIVGLDIKLMHHLINDMGKMIIEGIVFKAGDKHPNILLGEYLFSSVEEIYYKEHFGHAINYYQGEDFQVLQCLWPTKKGLFPTDLGCPESFQNCQSLVPTGGNLSAHSHSFSGEEWPFEDPPTTVAFTTTRVMHEEYPVLLVSHDYDGDWQILCGTTLKSSDSRVVCLGCAFEKNPDIGELANLPLGWKAWRETKNSPWIREPS